MEEHRATSMARTTQLELASSMDGIKGREERSFKNQSETTIVQVTELAGEITLRGAACQQ